ncbi:integrase family protein [Solidesulfovibrio fructosivorans JJ]]|uniref:Integrase family protein n=1 Tax=Solidesulfovibrio fructosivorans JJ] TaxID=596151 RepID=E1JXE8_SOLFR|nr:site-specific integrase [Solidesulfovibrio fructosivorans]EFL50925.1 integrase family protein [Solidesulfovibrio fructosivorans JJ]]
MQWTKTSFPGVRYREHPERKHGIKPDRYFAIRYQADGKRREEGLGWGSEGWTAQKAAVVLAGLKKAHVTGEGPKTLQAKRDIEKAREEAEAREKAVQEAEAVTFGFIFEGVYLEHARQNKKPNTVQTEQGLFRKWLGPVIGDVPLKDISPFHLERIRKNIAAAGLSARSAHYALCVVRQVFNFARDHDMTDCVSPTCKVKAPKTDNRRLRFLTHEEADKLLEHVAKRSHELHAISLVSLHCGLRAGEIFNLTWSDVDFDRETLTLRDTKNGRTRIAYMTGQVRGMLAARVKGGPGDPVFPGRGGVRRSYVSNAFERAVKDLGFNEGITDSRQKVVFHSLRHTFASWLVEQGTDLYSVKELMGHRTLSMTERYSHLSPDSLRRAVKGLEAGIAAKSEEPQVLTMGDAPKRRKTS